MCVVALLRRRNSAGAAAVGLAIFGVAGLAASFAHPAVHPDEGATTLALLVLGAAAIRVLPGWQVAIIAVVGAAEVAACSADG